MQPEVDLVVVTLNVPPQLEEMLIDWLLVEVGSSGFTGYRVYGRSASMSGLSAAEQVSGRRRRSQYDVEMKRSDVGAFLAAANEAFGHADVHCLVLPVIAAGELGAVALDLQD